MFSTLFHVFLSFLIIYVLHFFWHFLKDQFAPSKAKDVVRIQAEKYKKIVEQLQENQFPFDQQEMAQDLSQFVEEMTTKNKIESI
jgi:hypothetical protein